MNNLPEILKKIYNKIKKNKSGNVASYIPELKNIDPNIFAISICMVDGMKYNIGDFKKKISIQSVSKVFTLALSLQENGLFDIKKKIGSQGSFLPFDSIISTNISETHTLNPFVNAGAIATTSTIKGRTKKDIWEKIYNNLNSFAGKKLDFSTTLFNSEIKTNQKNKSLAYLLKSHNRFYGNVEDIVEVYTKQGSVLLTSEDLSVMAAVFANKGIHPINKKKIINEENILYILGQMLGGGMYEYSNTWIIDVGLPAKSGVGGYIMIIVPGIMGISIVSPQLDKNGNSVKGIMVAEELSKKLKLNILQSYCNNLL